MNICTTQLSFTYRIFDSSLLTGLIIEGLRTSSVSTPNTAIPLLLLGLLQSLDLCQVTHLESGPSDVGFVIYVLKFYVPKHMSIRESS